MMYLKFKVETVLLNARRCISLCRENSDRLTKFNVTEELLNEIRRNVFAEEPEKLVPFKSPWSAYSKKKSAVY